MPELTIGDRVKIMPPARLDGHTGTIEGETENGYLIRLDDTQDGRLADVVQKGPEHLQKIEG